MENRFYCMAFAMFFFLLGCKTKKHIQLETTVSKSNLHIDSNYIDSITSNVTSFKTTRINFDTLGKPTSITINEAVKATKKEVRQGDLKKDISDENKSIKRDEIIERDGSNLFSINYWGLIPVLLIIALIIYLYRKKSEV